MLGQAIRFFWEEVVTMALAVIVCVCVLGPLFDALTPAQRSRPLTTEERVERLEKAQRELQRDVKHLNDLHDHRHRYR